MTEREQIDMVEQDGCAIAYIKNPSEAVQLAAVSQKGDAIYYIKNPSEAVQLAAVKQNGDAIDDIKNPSEAVQLAAGLIDAKESQGFAWEKALPSDGRAEARGVLIHSIRAMLNAAESGCDEVTLEFGGIEFTVNLEDGTMSITE